MAMVDKRKPNSGQFKPGQSGNPGGKPLNARNAVTKRFLEALAKDFEAHGEEAISACREIDPSAYVKVVASLLPKEFAIERPLEGLSDEEIVAGIAELRARLGATSPAGGAIADPGGKTTTH